MNKTFLNNLDTDKISKIVVETDDNVTYFNNASKDVVKKYSEALDGLMSDIYVECVKGGDVGLDTLNRYYLELSNMIYFMIEKLEQLGAYASLSRSASKEVYSKHYLESQVKDTGTGKNRLTVAELQARAELGSQYESVVADIYEHAYKVVKGKVSSAQDMMNTLRRIISTKTSELNLSSYGPQQNRAGFSGEGESEF